MTWWAWTIVWLLLVIGSAGFLFLVVRSLWRAAAALLRELGEAATRWGAVAEQLDQLNEALARPEPELAVFVDPQVLRRARDREVRKRVARGRAQARRAGRARPRAADR